MVQVNGGGVIGPSAEIEIFGELSAPVELNNTDKTTVLDIDCKKIKSVTIQVHNNSGSVAGNYTIWATTKRDSSDDVGGDEWSQVQGQQNLATNTTVHATITGNYTRMIVTALANTGTPAPTVNAWYKGKN